MANCNTSMYKYNFVICTLLLFYCGTECCRFGSDANCAFECRCKEIDEVCDAETGKCQSGCAESLPPGYGWGGPGCRIGNIALNKSVEEEIPSGEWYVHRYGAVDGNVDGHWTWHFDYDPDVQTCSHTNGSWWMVDLGFVSVIHNISIYNRLDDCCKDRIRYFGIKIGLSANPSTHQHCYTNDGSIQDVYEFSCDGGYMTGRYVQMYLAEGNNTVMNFCEFVVMGHPKIDCSMCNTTCNEVTGCESCVPGLMLPDCKDSCPQGYSGVNCLNDCSKRCAENVSCDSRSGHCHGSCKQWWAPETLCDTYIELPTEENTIRVTSATYYSITIEWNGISNAPEGYEHHYQYTIHYKSTTNPENIVTVPHSRSEGACIRYTLTELVWNTNYTIWIKSYRVWKEDTEAGLTISVYAKTEGKDTSEPKSPLNNTTIADVPDNASTPGVGGIIGGTVVGVLISVAAVVKGVMIFRRKRITLSFGKLGIPNCCHRVVLAHEDSDKDALGHDSIILTVTKNGKQEGSTVKCDNNRNVAL